MNEVNVVGVNGDLQKSVKMKSVPAKKLKNLINQDEYHDDLHSRPHVISNEATKCTNTVCQSSIMDTTPQDVVRNKEDILKEAEKFFKQYYESIKRENSHAHLKRLEEVNQEVLETGTYQLKNSELVFGAKLAWRNSTRCIGRIQWKKLQVFDCREVTTARGMYEALCNHIKYATNKGYIRSAITIFPQRTDGSHDYRIWNPQLINYAGYKLEDGTIMGDPARLEFTQVCMKLGWNPEKKTEWDLLPLVLSADGKDPEFFEIPREIVLEVEMEHPQYDWFKELGLRWYAMPAVSNMRMDCGGLEFTATAFNGWYMGTEIGCRNFCDSSRYNITEKVAKKMGLDTNSNSSLWKDRALVEVNIAVLHSFHKVNASIVDHHSASEQFMTHLQNEKTRGGCPADWIWIVPPMSGSLTSVFHQEMALYYLKPTYNYQEPAWKTYHWSKNEDSKPRRKFHFKQIARAVRFTSKLFSKTLARRIKATILYASETGKSEQYAKELGTIFGHAFNAQVHCMSDYDMFSIEHETLLLIVSSTFGNGEPPTNGADFADHLFQMLYGDKSQYGDLTSDIGSQKLASPKSLMRTNSLVSPAASAGKKMQLTRLESNKSTTEHIGPLSNVLYAVFGLGSSAYPKFCNFGKTIDKVLHDLGGERLLEVACGDELFGQEQEFRKWASNIFHLACETFCLDEDESIKDAKNALKSLPLQEETVRFGKANQATPLKNALGGSFRKQLVLSRVEENRILGDTATQRATIFVNIRPESEMKYDPGDHIGIMPCNRKEIVTAILSRCKDVDQFNRVVQLQLMKEELTITGKIKTWERHEKIPPVTIWDMFSRFLDITTPPTSKILKYLAHACSDKEEAARIKELAMDSDKYDDWRHFYYPNLADTLELFPSCKPQASLLAALLPMLQPRYYSISSSPLVDKGSIHMTVAVVTYKTQNGNGPTHYGVCSNYLHSLEPGNQVYVFTRRAPSFHMPKDISKPLILIGPGTGIAPFRSFWHQRKWQMNNLSPNNQKLGPALLFFGCRVRGMDLYSDEKQKAINEGTLTKTLLALSRESDCDKKYVQDLMEEEGKMITNMLLEEGGHFYVCGDCKMAEDVQQKLKFIIKSNANMTTEDVDNFILELMDENRYHEDIFGITLRTAEVQKTSREYAKQRQASAQSSA